jgi:phage-related minor tail protein
MNSDSDLYGDDIHLWSERQGALLRRLAAGEAVSDQVDWPHVVEEIEDLGHDHAQRSAQDEVAELAARLAAAEALVTALRGRLNELTGKLADTQTKLAKAQGQVDAANARARIAVKAEQDIRQADSERKARGRWARLRAAWRGE